MTKPPQLNTSTLGYDLVPTSDQSEDRDGFRGWLDDIQDEAADFLNDIGNDIADRLSEEIGISQWYSIHMMTLCRGEFEPNATESDPDLNVTSCTRSSPDSEFFLLLSHTDPLTDTSKIASTSPRSSTMNSTRAPFPSHSPTSTGPMRSTTPSTPSTTSSSPPSSSTAWPSASPVSP